MLAVQASSGSGDASEDEGDSDVVDEEEEDEADAGPPTKKAKVPFICTCVLQFPSDCQQRYSVCYHAHRS